MGKHAYLIVAHSNLSVLEVCLKLLDDKRNDLFLLFDKKAKIPQEYCHSLERMLKYSNLSICHKMVNWGGYSQVSAVMHLIHEALNTDGEYDYIHYLQGADLPIKTQDEIHSFFNSIYGAEYISIYKGAEIIAQNKCYYRHFFCHNRFFRKNRFVKALNFGFVKIQKLMHIQKNTDIALFQGSALFSITSEFARYLSSRETEIHKRFRYSLAVDEVFIQSIISGSPYRERLVITDTGSTSNARLIDRTRPDGKNSPHIWRMDEFEYIINQPTGVCFARKFDEKVDFEIVERIYLYISKKGSEVK